MSASAQASPDAGLRVSRWPLRRAAFLALLVCAVLVPHVKSDAFTFPAVADAWSLLPFAALLILPFLDLRHLRSGVAWKLALLAGFLVPLGLEHPPRQWPVVLAYPLLGALFAVMAATALRPARARRNCAEPLLPQRWLIAGIAILALVHVSWALSSNVWSDIAEGGTRGAHSLIEGRPLYGDAGALSDAHLDTYGPVNYAAYVPFVAVAGSRAAAHEATLFFDLLTALLLFVLGRRLSGSALGVVLAYAWLAFPLALDEDALGFNDSIVAASLVLVLLAGTRPARRGAAAALAGFTKLAPLALLPLLLGDAAARGDGGARRALPRFAAAFAVSTVLLFAPVLAHSSLHAFVSRTVGFQAGRSPSESVWAALDSVGARWVAPAADVLHGTLVAATAGLVLFGWRVRRRLDEVGLAAACAAVLVALEACLSYFSYSYVLWFAPLALVAILARDAVGSGSAPARRAP